MHSASMGATWQAVVSGFCGLKRDADDSLTCEAHLPETWKSVRFQVYDIGQWKEISGHEYNRVRQGAMKKTAME